MHNYEEAHKYFVGLGLAAVIGLLVWMGVDDFKYDAQCHKQGGTPYHLRDGRYCMPWSQAPFVGIKVKGFDN